MKHVLVLLVTGAVLCGAAAYAAGIASRPPRPNTRAKARARSSSLSGIAGGPAGRRTGIGMNPVTTVSGTAYPRGAKNIDTDVIIPAHWLKTITRVGLDEARSRRYGRSQAISLTTRAMPVRRS